MQPEAEPSTPHEKAVACAQRVVILSDTHMFDGDRGAGTAEALRPLWQGADRVVFNGDTAEVRAKQRRDASHQRIEELRRLTQADGVELALVAGNHDPFVSDLDWLELCGGAVVLTHGDVLHPAVSPWAEAAEAVKAEHDRELERLSDAVADADRDRMEADFAERLEAAKRAAARKWRGQIQERYENAQRSFAVRWRRRVQRVGFVLYYWWTMPGRAKRLAREDFPKSRVLLFGHIHLPGVWIDRDALGPGQDRIVINTGSFYMPKRPRAVVIEDGRLTFWMVRGSGRRGFRLARKPVFECEFDPRDRSNPDSP